MKKLIVTGAANGIGRATVEMAIQQGYFVIGADKDAEGLKNLQGLYGADVFEAHIADFSDRAVIKGFIPTLYERHATIYGLVNNAGIYHGKSVYAYSDEQIDEILTVNLKALVYLSKDFAEREMRHEAPRSIVNIASVAGEVGSCDALYGATKAAVIGLTKANAWNFAPFVRVNVVSPALIHDTAIYGTIPEYRRAEYARQEVLKDPILPSGVAEVILLLVGDAMRHITGRVIPVDNGALPTVSHSMRKKKLLLVGAGNLCLQILKILGPKNAFEFVVLGRTEEATIRLCNLVALSCAQLGQFIAIKPVIADLTDIGSVAQLLREEAPDLLVNCASLQSWRVITGLPKLSFEKLDQAQFGPWLPMHLTLMHCLMQAVKASGITTKTVNAAFPDAVNPILARVGLAPDIGVGNVANLIPAVRLSIARLLECAPADVQVQLYAQHYFSHYVPRAGLPPRASYRLLYEVRDRPELTRLPDEAIFSTVKTEFRRLGGVDGQFLTACSAVTVIEGLFSPTPVLVHAPGPLGLPGGYPVWLQDGRIEVQFSEACPQDEAVRLNTICQSQDGIDEIHCDGSVTYNPQCMAVMQSMLGYSKHTMSIEQSAEFARELASKYLSFKNSTW